MRRLSKYLAATALTGGLLLAGIGLFPGVTGTGSVAVAEPPEHHPHIRHAIAELREARRELKEAAHDFGGHRKEALEAVDAAIRQLERALKFDRR